MSIAQDKRGTSAILGKTLFILAFSPRTVLSFVPGGTCLIWLHVTRAINGWAIAFCPGGLIRHQKLVDFCQAAYRC
jgi:hypothetical protein